MQDQLVWLQVSTTIEGWFVDGDTPKCVALACRDAHHKHVHLLKLEFVCPRKNAGAMVVSATIGGLVFLAGFACRWCAHPGSAPPWFGLVSGSTIWRFGVDH